MFMFNVYLINRLITLFALETHALKLAFETHVFTCISKAVSRNREQCGIEFTSSKTGKSF